MATPTSKSYCHRGGITPLLGETIPEHFANIVKRFPDSEAIVSITQRRRLSYAQLKSEVDILARGLLGFGFKKGERIGIWSTNNVEWLLLQMERIFLRFLLTRMLVLLFDVFVRGNGRKRSNPLSLVPSQNGC